MLEQGTKTSSWILLTQLNNGGYTLRNSDPLIVGTHDSSAARKLGLLIFRLLLIFVSCY